MNAINDAVSVNIEDFGRFEISRGTVLGDFLREIGDDLPGVALIAVIDNVMYSLHYTIDTDCDIRLLGAGSVYGQRVLRKSAVFILEKACLELFPEKKLVVRSTIANGLYLEFHNDTVDEDCLDKIKTRMESLIMADFPINLHLLEKREAVSLFAGQGQNDTAAIIEMRDKALVHVYELNGFYDYIYDFMVYSTGAVAEFRLTLAEPGIILQVPEADGSGVAALRPYVYQPQLFRSYRESKHWAELMDIPHVAALNRVTRNGGMNDLILINEALHEKKIAYIADRICTESERRVILIAGPSASGKTSFAHRLLIQLRANGKHPLVISLDNYFVDRIHTPLDADGSYDFESLYALKLETFNEHLKALLKGETVEAPVYNFQSGASEKQGVQIALPFGEPVILEGIHCLNDELTVSVPDVSKFRIYVSALTHLNLDYRNHISTTDLRLLRRIVRDARTRGYEAGGTIMQWPSVRRGEEQYIFRFQENAHVMFNSSLVYELPILKPILEPQLKCIAPRDGAYVEATRLMKLLSYILPVDAGFVPRNSILAEFVGGSCFNV